MKDYITKKDLQEFGKGFSEEIKTDIKKDLDVFRKEIKADLKTDRDDFRKELNVKFDKYRADSRKEIDEYRDDIKRYMGILSEDFQHKLGFVIDAQEDIKRELSAHRDNTEVHVKREGRRRKGA